MTIRLLICIFRAENELTFNFILTVCAIVASFMAILTFIYSIKIRSDERKSRRVFIVPADEPGYLQKQNNKTLLRIQLFNKGSNICNTLTGYVSFISRVGKNNKRYLDVIRVYKLDYFNPVPFDSPFDCSLIVEEFEEMILDFVVYEIEYNDRNLKTKFPDIFYWKLSEENKLTEVEAKDYNEIIKIDFEKRYKETYPADFS